VALISGLAIAQHARAYSRDEAAMTMALPVHNLYPAMMRFYDPVPVSAFRPFDNKPEYALLQHYTSIFLFDELPVGRLLSDMEIYTVELQADRAIGESTEIGLTIPVHYATGGFLDPFLRSYHEALGLPNSGRELQPDNQYSWDYSDAGGNAVWSDQAGWEMGNISLRLRQKLTQEEGWGLSMLAALQLPTASKSRGWGRGAPDVAAGAVYSWKKNSLFGHLEGWLIHPFAKDESGLNIQSYARASTTLGWQLKRPLSLLVQIQGGLSPYDSGIQQLDQSPSQISFGIRWAMSRKAVLTFAFVENMSQQTTPDFGFTIGLNFFNFTRK